MRTGRLILPGATGLLMVLCALCAFCGPAAGPVAAQQGLPGFEMTAPRGNWRQRLPELDRLLGLEQTIRAAELLQRLAAAGAPESALMSRRARLAQLQGDHERAVALCEEGLVMTPDAPRLLRRLAESLLTLGRLDETATVFDRILASSSNPGGVVPALVNAWRVAGHPERGLALCDSLLAAGGRWRALPRLRAACLVESGDVAQGTLAFAQTLIDNPLNLPLVRAEALDLLGGRDARDLAASVLDTIAGPTWDLRAVLSLRVDLHLQRGDAAAARAAVVPLHETPQGGSFLLQNVALLVREAELMDDGPARTATYVWSLTVLEDLLDRGSVSSGLRPRVLDTLAGACEAALAAGLLDTDPELAVARLEEVLERVRRGSPGSSRLYTAQISLARFVRDELRRPERAAAQLERLLVDLDLPLEGVALCRLELGVSHLAAGDSSRARTVLTRLGRSPRFPEAAGHAHYLLARLDMAQGHWETARDRFASVALDNPRADFANDALDLGLLLAEELENPVGGPPTLIRYAPVALQELMDRPDSLRAALAEFVEWAGTALDTSSPQPLLERALYALALARRDSGEIDAALALCDRIVLDHPDGRYPDRALALKGEMLEADGRGDEARLAWERLLLQYPDAMIAEDVRESLRRLP